MTTATAPIRKTAKTARSIPAKTTKTIRLSPAKAAGRKLRIRDELLPKSARYAEMNGREYVCIPVKDFGDWYEEIEECAAYEEFKKHDDGVRIPFEEVKARIETDRKCRLCRKYGHTPNCKTAKVLDEAYAGKNMARITMEELRQIWNGA